MAECILLRSGASGIDPGELTAEPGDVIKGKIAGVSGSDEPEEGTLELTGDASAGDILKGKTAYIDDPKKKVTGSLELTGNIGAADIRKGKKGYSTDSKKIITGTMAEQAAQTITPGTANKTIAANRYLTGTQTILGDKNLVAANIIKGKTIFGVKGTAVYAGDTPGYFLEPPKEYEELTGGWKTYLAEVTRGTSVYTVIYNVSGVKPNNRQAYIFTDTLIDMSKYRYIYVDYKNAYDDSREGSGESNLITGTYLQVRVSSGDVHARVSLGTTSSKKSGTLKLDVSNISDRNRINVGFSYTGQGTVDRLKSGVDIVAVRYDKIQ